MIGAGLLFTRNRDGLGERCGREGDPGDVARLASVGEQGVDEGRGGRDSAGDRRLEQVARRFAPDLLLERGGRHADAVEAEGVGVAAEAAVGRLERLDAEDRLAHLVIARREAEPGGLGVERGLPDKPLENGTVESEPLRLGEGHRLPGLGADPAELVLQRPGIVDGGDLHVADPADPGGAAAEAADAEAREPDDQQADDDPDDEPTRLALAPCHRHASPSLPALRSPGALLEQSPREV